MTGQTAAGAEAPGLLLPNPEQSRRREELSELRAAAETKPETPPAARAPDAAEPADVERLREAVAKKALQLAVSLCSGDDAAWRGVKKLQSSSELRSARVGLTRRLLFTVGPDGNLIFEAFLERRDFETYLKQRR